MARLRVCLAVLVLFFANQKITEIQAGDLGLTSISTFLDWEPSDCSKPFEPTFSCYDKFSCQSAIDEYNSYVGEVRSYIDCIVSEAESDAKTVRKAIVDGLEDAQNEVTNELDYAKSDLESALSSEGYSLR